MQLLQRENPPFPALPPAELVRFRDANLKVRAGWHGLQECFNDGCLKSILGHQWAAGSGK
jgi:hypothetical protein